MALDTTALTPVSSFTTALYPPKIGTPVSAADVAAGEQVLLNRTLYLGNGYGFAGFVERTADTTATLETFVTTSWVDSATNGYEVFPALKSGDFILIDITGDVLLERTHASDYGEFRVKVIDQNGGASPATFHPAGARQRFGNDSITGTVRGRLAITAARQVTLDGDVRVSLEGQIGNLAIDILLVDILTIRITAFRQLKL